MTRGTDKHAAKVCNNAMFNTKRESTMKTNEGNWDRIARVVGGLVLIGLAATNQIGLWGWIGVVPLATGAMGWCPLYTMLGINTCPMKR